ncbi:MAG: hypothetical protein A3H23_04570 [Planctomycetes bacterium RIFCSPLOWO2_12_FULL_40_19]|nr:MAG: hypothetical protein A3H23_04570 [Planctomycetes bacterium RIFCSPLOWO2_12_FULL_40_19]
MNISSRKTSIGLSIKCKLLLFTLCISLIPIASITTLYYINAHNIIKQHKLDDLTAIAESRKIHIMSFLEAKKDRALDYSTDGFIREKLETINHGDFYSKKEAVIALNRHLSVNKKPIDHHIIAINIVNRYGKIVASTNETLIGRDIPDQEAIAKIMDKIYDKPCISQPYYTPLLNTKCIDVSAPIISSGNDEVSGILINHYELSILSDITTNRVGLGESGEIYLVNSDRIMITESRFIEDAPLRQVVDTEPVQKILEHGATMTGVYPDYRGVPIVGSSMYMPEYGWILLAEKDKAEVFASIRVLDIIAMIVGITSTAVIIGVGIVFAVSLSRPIRKLTHATERLADGDLGHKVELSRKDEIGILADSFDTMRIRLGKLLKSIEEGKKEWESTFDSVRDIIALYGKDQRLIRCNKALLEGLNVKSEEIIGKKYFEIFNQIKKEDLSKCAVMEMAEIMKPVTNEIEVLCLGGIYSISSFPRFDNNGEFVGTVQIMKDITERKQLEIQFRSVVDNSSDGIIVINEQGIIRLFNPAAERLFGYTVAEVTGQNIKMLMPEPYHSEHDGYLHRYISTGKGYIIGIGPREVEGLRRDGATFSMELSVAEMHLAEKRMFVGIMRDITRRKAMEKNIRESYKMASLGTLTAGVCHEVLNPLNIISSYTQLLLTDTKEGSETEQDLKKILEEVGRIVRITDNLLRFSRREKLETGEVEINSLLEKTISIVEPEIKLENIKLLTRFEKGLPEIMANSDELRQVFFNLTMNARDAMPEGGKLTISTQSIEKRGKPFVSIKFKDTGGGISEENLNSVFDPFFTTKKEGKGTGLGLSISHGIIENHGGEISVNSKEGKGTTFIIDLPVKGLKD